MKSEELRSLQTPLKDRYREAPDAAFITLRAQGRLSEGVSCKIETGKALVVAGLHPASGGSGQGACSGDILLEALVACAGVTLNAVATALDIELRNASLQAEGDLDFRGTLGLSKEVPVGFQNIRLQVTLDRPHPAGDLQGPCLRRVAAPPVDGPPLVGSPVTADISRHPRAAGRLPPTATTAAIPARGVE